MRILNSAVWLVSLTHCLSGYCEIAKAEFVVSHLGAVDPTSGQWNTFGSGNGVTVGSVNDGGVDSWIVDDNSTVIGSFFGYDQVVNSNVVSAGNTNGWTLSTNIRIASDEEQAFEGSPFVGYRDGSLAWQMNFGLTSGGDTLVRLLTGGLVDGPTHVISGNSDYNTFTLRYNAADGNADLLVNGVEVINGYSGFSSSETRVLWGAASSADSGQGNFNSVTFIAAPEPTSFILATTMILGFLVRRNRPLSSALHR